MGPEGKAARLTRAAPNKALEPTPYSLRSFLASAFGRGSPPAFGRDKMEVSRQHDFQIHSGNEQGRTHAACLIQLLGLALIALR